jgi:hypothetical protein
VYVSFYCFGLGVAQRFKSALPFADQPSDFSAPAWSRQYFPCALAVLCTCLFCDRAALWEIVDVSLVSLSGIQTTRSRLSY